MKAPQICAIICIVFFSCLTFIMCKPVDDSFNNENFEALQRHVRQCPFSGGGLGAGGMSPNSIPGTGGFNPLGGGQQPNQGGFPGQQAPNQNLPFQLG